MFVLFKKKQFQILPCVCGTIPKIKSFGDYKQYNILLCPVCGMTIDYAFSDYRKSIKTWNKKANEYWYTK